MAPDRNDTTFQIPIDAPMTCLQHVWNSVVEVLTSVVLLWIEPIMDSNSLIDLSIGMLLMQRVGVSIQRYEPKALIERVHTRESSSWEDGDSLFLIGFLYVSPFFAVVGFMALVISCGAHSRPNDRRLAPLWVRAFLPRHHHHYYGGGSSSVALMYLLLILFAVESLLMVSILMFGLHAITFPEWLEGDLQVLTFLICAWITSMLTSSFVRYHLYYSIGD